MAARLRASDAKSNEVRKGIEKHKFEDEGGEEYKGSNFGGFSDYFRRKKIKLQNLDVEIRASIPDKPTIFRGVVAHVNGYTQPSLNDLHRLLVAHGGGFQQYLDGKTTVTHIIAANLTLKKRVEFRRYRIVKPAWVVDSVKAEKLLPWDAYRVVDEGVGQKVLGFDNGKVISQANAQQLGYRDQMDTSWYARKVQGLAKGISDGSPGAGSTNTQTLSHEGDRPSSKDVDDDPRQSAYEVSSEAITLADERGTQEPAAPDAPAVPLTVPALGPWTDKTPTSSTEEIFNEMQTPPMHSHLADLDQEAQPSVASEGPVGPPIEDEPSSTSEELHVGVPADGNGKSLKRVRSPEVESPSKKARMTAEEHNTVLLADPHMRKSSVLNPDFLRQYYSESRLHHLSTWKADLKSRLQQLAAEKTPSQQARQKRPPGSRRYILHVDFDSFFAAVSLKNAPQHKDKAVVIAHGKGSGSEIASCNYVARGYGVKNGMWMKRAHELCPDLVVLPYDYKAYEEASMHFYDAVLATDGIVQSVSIDEALVDITMLCLPAGAGDDKGVREGSIWREQAKADEVAQKLRALVLEKTGCAVSVGIGGNILQAKVALRKAKPAGQHQIKPEEVLDFIGELTVKELPGVAWSIGGKLEEVGAVLVKDLRGLSKERLVSTLGPKTGEKMWDYSRGIDRTEVGEQVIRKSVSAEVNWGVRFETQAQADEFVRSLCGELHRRLVEHKVKGRHLTMKIMRRAADAPLDPPKHLGHGKCDTYNKSVVLGVSTNTQDVLAKEALSVMRSYGFSPGELRGLGVQMTKLEPLKDVRDGQLQSSQRRLHFKTSPSKPSSSKVDGPDPIEDGPDRPQKVTGNEPLPTPAESGGGPRKPLNTLGTQFVIPTQIDPNVLAELPQDIRAKVLQSRKSLTPSRPQGPTVLTPRSLSPGAPPDVLNHSRLDPETIAALPTEMRQEILAFSAKEAGMTRAQSPMRRTPRKASKSAVSTKKVSAPTKRRAGVISRGRGKVDIKSTLTQSNFVARTLGSEDLSSRATSEEANGQSGEDDEIAPEILEALPEDIRREVMAQHRADRLAWRGNSKAPTSLPTAENSPAADLQQAQPKIQRFLRLPPRKAKPTFTTRKLSTLPELREVISAWVEEFADEGPYEEDERALTRYVGRVVKDECNMDKAAGVVKWLEWVVDNSLDGKGGEGAWRRALAKLKDEVQAAVASRGLGSMRL
ncbi:MAG: deoxycytidyl transferase [Thelocarpon impressellum]|nr:MAG: deoxycytidyl transferase [Thelocarpon impressellum]